MPNTRWGVFDFDDVLFLCHAHYPDSERGVFCAESPQQHRNRVGAHLAHGLICFFLPQVLCYGDIAAFIVSFQPNAQPLALINRLTLAQHLPHNHADKRDHQHGERDLDPFSHSHFTPPLAAASGSMAFRALVTPSLTSASGALSDCSSAGSAILAAGPNSPSARTAMPRTSESGSSRAVV